MMPQYTPSQLAAHQAQKERHKRLGFPFPAVRSSPKLPRAATVAQATSHHAIKSVVAQHFCVSVEDIESDLLDGETVTARTAAIHISTALHPYQSPSQIGAHFGGRRAEAITRLARNAAVAIESDLAFAQTVRMLFDRCNRAVAERPAMQRAVVRAPKPFLVSASHRTIQTIVADYFAITLEELIGANATRKHAMPRQVAAYVVTKVFPTRPLRRVGELFAGRDHATIHHAVEKIKKMVERDPAFAAIVEGLIQESLVAVGMPEGAPDNANG